MEISLSIPLDNDGFLEMECDYCKNRFMLHETVYSDESNLHFFCPICGLPNEANTFYCPEVLEALHQKAMNYVYSEIKQKLGPSIRKMNKSGFIKMSLKVPKQEPEKELYTPANEYILFHHSCCGVEVKALEIDAQIGLYCPICGESRL